MLWLTGVPGAGKTVLSSFVINRCSEVSGEDPSPPVLYFFFKMTDSDKNSILAVTSSLVYQLYSLFPASLCTDIVSLRDESGKEKALSDQRLWDLFLKHAKNMPNLTIVLDALDECDEIDVFLGRVLSLLQCCPAKVLVVSRKEENIALALTNHPHIAISEEDVEDDIRSYVTAEIENIPRFQGKPVQRRMITALTSGHGGMFLWAYLMVKELKELGTVRQVDRALKSLPTGLEEMHEAIITRLDSTLHRAHRELATRILTWVVCAVRPLRLAELQEILRFEIRQGRIANQSPVDDDDDLLYSEKDIELACGALVRSTNATLQLIHLSTKEILTRKPPTMRSGDSRLAFYVDAQRENPHMAALCVSYMSTHLNGIDSVTRPNLENVSRLRFSEESYDLTELVMKSPFIDYASISWQAHLIDGDVNLELEDVTCCLQTLLTYDLTMLWIESCVALHQDSIWTLERNCKGVMSWADCALVPAESSCHKAIGFLWAWSSAVVSIINEYGGVLEKYPYEIHFLDLRSILSENYVTHPAVLPASYAENATTQRRTVREHIRQIRAVEKHQSSARIEPYRQLQPNFHHSSDAPGFVLYDGKRDVYFSADSKIQNGTEILHVQERATGRRLQPVKSALNVSDVPCEGFSLDLVTAILCPERMYLAILYANTTGYFITSVWTVEPHLDFLNIRDRRPWARRLHCFASHNLLFSDSCLALTIGQDGVFYSPSGRIHPERGIQKRIPSFLVQISAPMVVWPKELPTLAFAGDGQTIIRLNPSTGTIEKISWLEDRVTKSLHSRVPVHNGRPSSGSLRVISHTARFVVFGTFFGHGSFPGFHLFDIQGNQQQLHNPDASTRFFFSQDEKTLLGIYTAGQRML